uniref:(northern house mosquito) hypothetical protein n=1 Tax=Culex pipiens TaxID=7175 RepID=A0A8D8CMR7_CULPI
MVATWSSWRMAPTTRLRNLWNHRQPRWRRARRICSRSLLRKIFQRWRLLPKQQALSRTARNSLSSNLLRWPLCHHLQYLRLRPRTKNHNHQHQLQVWTTFQLLPIVSAA